mgnify:CR=1 FL=1
MKKFLDRPLRFLIAGGGTGGHVFPAISIGEAIREELPDAEFLFVGARGRMEMERVPEAQFRIEGLPVVGMPRRRSFRQYVNFIHRFLQGFRQSWRLLHEFRPDVVIGVGGYASAPALLCAQLLRIPTLLQEQNSYAGRANRLLSKRAKKVCVAYEGMSKYFRKQANLLRQLPDQAASREALGLPKEGKVALVIGGSLGAKTLCDAVLAGLEQLKEAPGVTVVLQTGRKNYERVRSALALAQGSPRVRAIEFINDMPQAFAAADVIASRAGAIAISELTVVGKPAILVPSPNVAEDHQTKNAMALMEAGAVKYIRDSEAESKLMREMLSLLDDPESMKAYSMRIKRMAKPDAAQAIARLAISLAEKGLGVQSR